MAATCLLEIPPPLSRTACNERSFRSVRDSDQPESECLGWFCCRSVVLVFAGFPAWRFVRARSDARVEERGRTGFPCARRLVLSARRLHRRRFLITPRHTNKADPISMNGANGTSEMEASTGKEAPASAVA